MREGQNKIQRFIELDQFFRDPNGYTLDDLAKMVTGVVTTRTIRNDIDEFVKIYNANFIKGCRRGKSIIVRYVDPKFSIINSLIKHNVEELQNLINQLSQYQGDTRYDIVRYLLLQIKDNEEIDGHPFMSIAYNPSLKGLDKLDKLVSSILHKQPIKLTYRPFGEKAEELNIHPYHLRQYNNRWFLFGLLDNKPELGIQNYAIDRIIHIDDLSKIYIPTTINFDDFFNNIIGVSQRSDALVETILFKVEPETANYIRTKPLHHTQEERSDLSSENEKYFQIKVKINRELIMLLLSYGDALEVMEPLFMREKIARKIENLSQKYNV